MKFKTLLPAAIVFFLTSTMFAADKTILIELRVPKTVEVGDGTIEFVRKPIGVAILHPAEYHFHSGTVHSMRGAFLPHFPCGTCRRHSA